MRTTSALEGFNSQLGRRIPKKGNFFKFVKRLGEIEFAECRKMRQMVDSGGSINPRRDTARDISIRNTITIIEFLKAVTYNGNSISSDMAHFNIPANYISDGGEDSDDNDDILEGPRDIDNNEQRAADDLICIVCADQRARVLFLPCRHMKCCEECSSKLAAEKENGFFCPNCMQLVEDTIVVFV